VETFIQLLPQLIPAAIIMAAYFIVKKKMG
jgi:hypothetical protein